MATLYLPLGDLARSGLVSPAGTGAITNESCATGGIHQHRVRTASGSDRILRATQHKLLFRKLLFDPVATARGSDTIRGDSHI